VFAENIIINLSVRHLVRGKTLTKDQLVLPLACEVPVPMSVQKLAAAFEFESAVANFCYDLLLLSTNCRFCADISDVGVKGTVARDFLPPVFSTNRPHIVPKFTP
jgi:hypothetical protein